MCDGYHSTGEDDQSGLDDEFLCEYVDGTMDPSVREVFEEYLQANPALAEHVQCLRATRMLLCRYGCRRQAPEGLQVRLRRQLSMEMMAAEGPRYHLVAERLGAVATYTSVMLVMLVIGMTIGAAVGEEPSMTQQALADQQAGTLEAVSPGMPVSGQALPLQGTFSLQPLVSSFGMASAFPGGAYRQRAGFGHVADTLAGALRLRRSHGAP